MGVTLLDTADSYGSEPGASEAGFARMRGLMDRYFNDRNFTLVEKLRTFAGDRGHSLLQLAISWLAARPQVASVIAGATRPEQVEQNVEAAGRALTEEDLEEIDRLSGTAR